MGTVTVALPASALCDKLQLEVEGEVSRLPQSALKLLAMLLWSYYLLMLSLLAAKFGPARLAGPLRA